MGSTSQLHAKASFLTFSWTIWLVIWTLLYHLGSNFVLLSRAVDQARTETQRATEAELALRTSELERLSQQVEPHFLFNALTAVVAARHDPEAVGIVTTALAEYLRFCLSRSANCAPLGRELDALQNLLTVHQARFGVAIDCRIDASPAARRVLVPAMVVTPLVDNALKFGIQTSPKPLTIAVEARLDGAAVEVTVFNSGTWIDGSNGDGRRGTGLANLRRRLELAGIAGASVTTAAANGGVIARLVIPMATSAGVADSEQNGPNAGSCGTTMSPADCVHAMS